MLRTEHPTFWQLVWKQFCKRRLGVIALIVISLFVLVGIYAPFLASSKPLFVKYDGDWYFPLFRYLFYPGFFTKRLDIFYNLLMLTFPLFVLSWISLRKYPWVRKGFLAGIVVWQLLLFGILIIIASTRSCGN